MGIYLTKHEGQQFESQTIMISGQAFIRCTFRNCTLILMNTGALLEGCGFENCSWHLNYLLTWGDQEGRKTLHNLLQMMDGGGGGTIRFSPN